MIFVRFIEPREGKEGARCAEQRRGQSGGRRDGNIDDVPKIGMMWEGEARGGGHGYDRQLPGGGNIFLRPQEIFNH